MKNWRKLDYYHLTMTKELKDRVCENIAVEHYEDLSAEDFVNKYEKKNIPVIIKGLDHNFKREKYWSFEVNIYLSLRIKELNLKIY